MDLLERKIVDEGKVYDGDILKVDGFLNHRIDVPFMNEIGAEFARLFANEGINKILTIEASGIGVACISAQHFKPCPQVVFAKKYSASNIGKDLYTSNAFSYTKGKTFEIAVSREYLCGDDRILIIDDFLAKGSALSALIEIVKKSGAYLAGVGIVIEKVYQGGGNLIRSQGIRVESLAKIESMSASGGIVFGK